MKAFDEFLTKYFPEGNRIDGSVMFGYTVAQGFFRSSRRAAMI
jgi:branched-chain amino acid transport system substrate-binding protein